jgi:hypothetical protein
MELKYCFPTKTPEYIAVVYTWSKIQTSNCSIFWCKSLSYTLNVIHKLFIAWYYGGFHGGVVEDSFLQGYDATTLGNLSPTGRRTILPLSHVCKTCALYDALQAGKHTWRQSKNVWQRFCDRILKRPLLTVSVSFMNVANSVLWRMAIILKANKVNLFIPSVLFVFWYHSSNILDTPRIASSGVVARSDLSTRTYLSRPESGFAKSAEKWCRCLLTFNHSV